MVQIQPFDASKASSLVGTIISVREQLRAVYAMIGNRADGSSVPPDFAESRLDGKQYNKPLWNDLPDGEALLFFQHPTIAKTDQSSKFPSIFHKDETELAKLCAADVHPGWLSEIRLSGSTT